MLASVLVRIEPLNVLLMCNPRASPATHPRRPPSALQAVRDLCGPVRRFVTRYKVPLELFSTANLAFIVWQVLSGAQSIRECPAVGAK